MSQEPEQAEASITSRPCACWEKPRQPAAAAVRTLTSVPVMPGVSALSTISFSSSWMSTCVGREAGASAAGERRAGRLGREKAYERVCVECKVSRRRRQVAPADAVQGGPLHLLARTWRGLLQVAKCGSRRGAEGLTCSGAASSGFVAAEGASEPPPVMLSPYSIACGRITTALGIARARTKATRQRATTKHDLQQCLATECLTVTSN